MNTVTADLVSERPDGSFCVRLIEEGPWPDVHGKQLQALETRLFDITEVVSIGNFVERFPASKDKDICIRLDCYDLPRESVDTFFNRFIEFIRTSDEWADSCCKINFEIAHRHINTAEQGAAANP